LALPEQVVLQSASF